MFDLNQVMDVLGTMGIERSILSNRGVAHLIADGNHLLSSQQIAGLKIQAESKPDGIAADLLISKETKIEEPIHFCLGLMGKSGTQRIKLKLKLEENAAATLMVHCFFPHAQQVKHIMDAEVEIGRGAKLEYSESHFHGPFGGVTVIPKGTVKVGPYGRYLSDFYLTTGRVGKLSIDYQVEVQEHGIADISARIFGRGDDDIKINEKMVLAGKASAGLIKTRVALQNSATSEVTSIMEGNAEGARGHMDCVEIVKDQAVAHAIPIVKVTHPLAKVTHEAAIGSVDQKQLETLMAHGLTPDEAVEMVVAGILR